MYFNTESTIDSVKTELSDSNQALAELDTLFAQSQRFVLTKQGFGNIDNGYSAIIQKLKNLPQLATQQEIIALETIQSLLDQVNRVYEEDTELNKTVDELFTHSISQAAQFLTMTTNKLIDETERSSVSTFERQIMIAAQEHVENNYKIWLIFKNMEKDISYADPLFDYMDQLDAANKEAQIKLQGTPALALAKAAGEANKALRGYAQTLLANQKKVTSLDSQIGQLAGQLNQTFAIVGENTIQGGFDKLSGNMLNVILLISSVLILVIALTIIFAGSITQPLSMLITRIRELSQSGGDLTYRLKMDRSDEIGKLAQEINAFLGSLHTIFSGVKDSTNIIYTSANDASKLSSQALQAMTNQQQENRKVQDAFGQMQGAIGEIANNADNAANIVNDTVTNTKDVDDVIAVMVKNITSVTTELESATVEIESLNRDSQNIGSILETIRSISDQTNLLALNAAIEAARAGEHGRGFAVVADEVRSLAQRTQQSTAEIDTMIANLQSSAQRVGEVVKSGNETIIDTNEQTQTVVASINHISSLITQLSDMNMLIASAVEEQSNVTQDINLSMQRIDEISNTTMDEANSAANVAESQLLSAENLKEIVAQFRT